MALLGEILAELYGMFLGDARLSLGVLGVVGVAALVATVDSGSRSLATGGVLLVGCLIVLAAAVRAGARRR